MAATATKPPPPEELCKDPQELTLRLEQVGGRLVTLAREGPGKKIAGALMESVQELRLVWSALRELSLVYDAGRVETMLEHERELRSAMEILNSTVDSLSRTSEKTAANVDEQLQELDEIDSIGGTGLMVERLRTVTGSVRDAASEVKDGLARTAASLDESEQIIQAVDRKLQEARLEVMRDSLTQVLSRTAFEQRLRELAEQPRAISGAWCLALADIDHVAAINEEFGRRVGDALLCKVVEIIQKTCDTLPGSLVGRYRGKEFGLLLPRCSLARGRELAEEIRGAVGLAKWECKVSAASRFVATTVSVGIAERRDGETAGTLLKRAEACLEQAKRQGRNAVQS